jgi:hypothetical protein
MTPIVLITPTKPPTPKRRLVRAARCVLAIVAISAGIVLVSYFAYLHRPQPAAVRRAIFEGVTYVREVVPPPNPLIIHSNEVDLTSPNMGFLVTPGNPAAAPKLW